MYSTLCMLSHLWLISTSIPVLYVFLIIAGLLLLALNDYHPDWQEWWYLKHFQELQFKIHSNVTHRNINHSTGWQQCYIIQNLFEWRSMKCNIWAPSTEFVSSSILSWQILTAHAQPFRGARDLAFCLMVPLDSLLVWASSGGSGETAQMRRLAWTFAARIDDKYQIRLTRPIWVCDLYY